MAVVYRLSDDDLLTSWQVFNKFSDKNWSFTVCTSKAVMENLNIKIAFTFDHHFQQFGTIIVLP
jgi:predicted nucleic acid-binding protein